MFGKDYKDRIIRYLENFYEFSNNEKEKIYFDDFLFIAIISRLLEQLTIELHYSADEIRAGAIKNEGVVIPVQMRHPVMGDGIIWDLEKLYFLY